MEESDQNFSEAFGHVHPATDLAPNTSHVCDGDDNFAMVDCQDIVGDKEELENLEMNNEQ